MDVRAPCCKHLAGKRQGHSKFRVVHHLEPINDLSHRMPVNVIPYKTIRNARKTTRKHNFAHSSVMRLTVLALFITLPAATYAAVCAQQKPIGFEVDCSPSGSHCRPDDNLCCDGLPCFLIPGAGFVCHIAHLF